MKFKSIFKTIFYGLCLGISLLPPGFSVATMAMILRIYEDLIELLNDLFSRSMKDTLKPFASLGVPNGIFDISTSLISGIIGFMVVTILNSKKIQIT